MSTLLQDIRFALRLLAKNPGFTLVTVLTLALGIGANSAIFSVVNAVLLRALPFREPGQLVLVQTQFPLQHRDRFWVSPPEFFELRRDARSYQSMGGWADGLANVGGGERPVRAAAAYVTPGLLPTLGVPPALGRFIGPDEDPPGDPHVVVLGHGVWTRAFGADRDIIGKHITVDAIPVTVVGVMPRGFDFPGHGVELWIPLGVNLTDRTRSGNHLLSVVARLHPGVTVQQARAEMGGLIASFEAAHQGEHRLSAAQHPMILHSLQAEITAPVRLGLLLLQGAVAFVLLIACANVSNLLLARAETRSREIAIRAMLGAGRRRLLRQLLTESAVIGLLGGGAGMLVALWLLPALLALAPQDMPRVGEVRVDAGVALFTLLAALGTSLLFGLAPILHTRTTDLHGALKAAGSHATQSKPRQRFRRALVIAEVALTVVLVVGSGLMIRSFVRVQHVDLGFVPQHLLTMQIELPDKTYPGEEESLGFFTRLLERLRGLPGVAGASLMSGLPPDRTVNANDIAFEGKTQSLQGPAWNVDFWQVVDPEYFRTMGIRLVRGRLFAATDTETAPLVVLVNETMARRFWPGEDPIGRRLQVTPGPVAGHWETVVGIVADVKQQGVDAQTGTEVYIPLRQYGHLGRKGTPQRLLNIVVKAQGEPRALLDTVAREVAALDRNLAPSGARTMDQVLYQALSRPRFLAALLTLFSALALVLAAVGVYGVMSYTVAQRTQEIGIRMALGARPQDVRLMVLTQGLGLAVVGVGAGVVCAVGLNLALRSVLLRLLFDMGVFDLVSLSWVALLVLAVAGLSCYLPAARATQVDPMIALRSE